MEDAFEGRLTALLPPDVAEPAADAPSPRHSVPCDEESGGGAAADPDQPAGIDKSVLSLPAPRRYRNKEHLRYVARQPCLVCGRKPSDPHHLRFTQPGALGRKTSDEFVVPLCRIHHRLLHRVGNEAAWWQEAGIDPIKVARKLWKRTRLGGGRDDSKSPNEWATAAGSS